MHKLFHRGWQEALSFLHDSTSSKLTINHGELRFLLLSQQYLEADALPVTVAVTIPATR
jgi:hypothetical protein